jgi:hypothetical protein
VVSQLVDGSTLRDRIAYGPLPITVVCELDRSLSEALGHMHTQFPGKCPEGRTEEQGGQQKPKRGKGKHGS